MNILIVASHPDDEILGCGGTICKLIRQGHKGHLLILGEGVTSRNDWKQSELSELKDSIFKANKCIGINEKDIMITSYPDNAFDSVPLLNIVKTVLEAKERFQPNMIFTHHEKCLNIDHQIAYQAVMTATRPMKEEIVKKIYSFEILSSTEWRYPQLFNPDVFFDIKETIKKIEAMNEYKSELREFPHPRSLYGVWLNAQYWGMRTGVPFAEAFTLVRDVE